MIQTLKNSVVSAVILSMLGTLPGCSTVQQADGMKVGTANTVVAQQEKAAQPIPVITKTSASWLMGQTVQVMPSPSPVLTQIVTYHPTQRVSLSDVAAWISQATGLMVDTAEVHTLAGNGQGNVPSAQVPAPSPVPAPMPSMASMPGSVQPTQAANSQFFSVSYEGPLSGLLDVVGNKAGVWSKFVDGRIVFFRTETKTFYLPAIARKSAGNSSIAANNGSSGAGGSSSGGAPGGGAGGMSSSSSGGATSTSEYAVDIWGDLEKTAKAVGNGAQVVTNGALGSVTVTGTPTQVRTIEEWVKSLSENLSQQVALTIHFYRVDIKNADNYAWNPNVVFGTAASRFGFTLSGPETPAITSGLSPLNLTASVLSTATGNAAKYKGSELAYQALSTLGEVTETVQHTIVTMNGQPAQRQMAQQTTYLASTTQPAQQTIGTAPTPPTLTPGALTTGFTVMLLPRIVNGKVLLAVNLTNSSLISLGTVSSGGSSIQTPNVDVSTFQQNVSLTPGDALLLSGLQVDSGSTNRSGVGAASNFLLGGGVGSNIGKQLMAIVVTAKVL